MDNGINTSVTEDEIAEFLINDGYSNNLVPVTCILSGSRAYGLATSESDRDYVGIHLMDTWACLEHPDYREDLQVIRKKFTNNLEEVPAGIKGGEISLDSFEMWKFISLITRGSFITFELLYMPQIHQDPASSSLLALCREALNNKIGKAAKGYAFHHWRRDKVSRKTTVMAFYRLLQAIHYLRETEFEWRADVLWDYVGGMIPTAGEVLKEYMLPEMRVTALKEGQVEQISFEIEKVLDELGRAMVMTKVPDQSPELVIKEILQILVRTRAAMI